jgi:hypothetical protein
MTCVPLHCSPSHRLTEISLPFHGVIMQLSIKFAESEWTDPIWKEFSHDRLSRRLYGILTQLGSIWTRTDADANVRKLELVEETKNV